MTDLTLEDLHAALNPLNSGMVALRSEVSGLRSELTELRSDLPALRSELPALRSELTELRSELTELRSRIDGLASEMANVRIRVDGLPLLGVAVETLRHDVRMTRAAINDMARVNITAGEVEAMHTDIDRTMARQDAMETRLATLERRAEEQQSKE